MHQRAVFVCLLVCLVLSRVVTARTTPPRQSPTPSWLTRDLKHVANTNTLRDHEDSSDEDQDHDDEQNHHDHDDEHDHELENGVQSLQRIMTVYDTGADGSLDEDEFSVLVADSGLPLEHEEHDDHDDSDHDEHDESDHDEHDVLVADSGLPLEHEEHDDHDESDHDEHDESDHEDSDEHDHEKKRPVAAATRPRSTRQEESSGVGSPCLTASEVFEQNDFDGNLLLNQTELASAVVQLHAMILSGCGASDGHAHGTCDPPTNAERWGYGMLSVVVISLVSVIGIVLIPINNKKIRRWLLEVLVAFAVGALMGDALLHLIPQALEVHSHSSHDDTGTGEEDEDSRDYVWKMWVVCMSVLGFLFLDSLLNWIVAGSFSPKPGSHGHSHDIELKSIKDSQSQLSQEKLADHDGLEHSGSSTSESLDEDLELGVNVETAKSVKKILPVGWLNLLADGIHNLVDGFALGIAWSASLSTGLSTSIAVFCHELPQELGDFAILTHAGFSKWQAIGLNLATACTAILGTVIGLAVGTSVETATPWLVAIIAGAFLYIAMTTMLPLLLVHHQWHYVLVRLFFVALGMMVLLLIALYEPHNEC
eukprot:CAMPEP_0174247686 /NCGR_PEP_ID=MMETSP0417-20130205/42700_1 /TAXON_ID=242541 /ORGANISM="Mayorella sp, Strain BSH-02190019" /LENGTH=593 /DNA_ID=CAMNT_0015327547 /DNA_START=63 /DNA_END=1844 /DNA_ORIENTATION=-